MSSGDDSDFKSMSKDMLEGICDSIQYHQIVNKIQTHYKIYDRSKQVQVEWKGALLSTRNMGNGLHKSFKAVVNEILQALPILGEYGLAVSYFVT